VGVGERESLHPQHAPAAARRSSKTCISNATSTLTMHGHPGDSSSSLFGPDPKLVEEEKKNPAAIAKKGVFREWTVQVRACGGVWGGGAKSQVDGAGARRRPCPPPPTHTHTHAPPLLLQCTTLDKYIADHSINLDEVAYIKIDTGARGGRGVVQCGMRLSAQSTNVKRACHSLRRCPA